MKLLTEPNKVTIGSDPESFLTREGKIISAIDLIGGTKEAPVVVKDGIMSEDNIMAEIGITPALTRQEFIDRHHSVIAELIVRTRAQPLIQAAAYIDEEILRANPNRAFKFGCDPDFNAYSLAMNPTPNSRDNLRTCAGHIHLGFEAEEMSLHGIGRVVKALDVTIGLWSVLADPDILRRQKYGKSGAFRPKNYGLEYRVPSNFWLSDDELMGEVFDRARGGYEMIYSGKELPNPEAVCRAIDSHDKGAATSLLKEAGVF